MSVVVAEMTNEKMNPKTRTSTPGARRSTQSAPLTALKPPRPRSAEMPAAATGIAITMAPAMSRSRPTELALRQPFSEHAAPRPSASRRTGKASTTSIERESAVSTKPR
jgi:hypothetical protein